MRHTLICSTMMIGLASTAIAQTPNPKLQFEVASVRPSAPVTSVATAAVRATLGPHGGPGTDQPELYSNGRTTLRNLMLAAFGVKTIQISGPAWLTENPDYFDISAKVPAGASKADLNVMLQNLLVDRFGLVFHRETKEVAGYELVVGKGGSKMTESVEQPPPPPPPPPAANGAQPAQTLRFENDRNGVPQMPAGRTGMLYSMGANKQSIAGRGQTMLQLANAIETTLLKPVVDKTGLAGKYDFGLGFDGSDLPGGFRPPQGLGQNGATQTPPADPAPSIFTAVQQDLGLRLDQKKVPVEFIVIDKLEKAPSEN